MGNITNNPLQTAYISSNGAVMDGITCSGVGQTVVHHRFHYTICKILSVDGMNWYFLHTTACLNTKHTQHNNQLRWQGGRHADTAGGGRLFSTYTSIYINLMYAKMRGDYADTGWGGMFQHLPNNNTTTQGGYDAYEGGDMFIAIDQ